LLPGLFGGEHSPSTGSNSSMTEKKSDQKITNEKMLKETFSQFYRHFTSSFYASRSQKRKKDWRLDCIFSSFVIFLSKS